MLFTLVPILQATSSFYEHSKVLLFSPHVRCADGGVDHGLRAPQCQLSLRGDLTSTSAIGDNVTLELITSDSQETTMECFVGRFAYSAIEALKSSTNARDFFRLLIQDQNSIRSQLGSRLGLTGAAITNPDDLPFAAPADSFAPDAYLCGLTSISRHQKLNMPTPAPFSRMGTISSANWKNCLNHAGGIHYNRTADVDHDKRCVVPEFLTHICLMVDGASLGGAHGCSGHEGAKYSRLSRTAAARLSLRDDASTSLADATLWIPLTVQVCSHSTLPSFMMEAVRLYVVRFGGSFADANVQHDDLWSSVLEVEVGSIQPTYLAVLAGLVLFFTVAVSFVFIFVRR